MKGFARGLALKKRHKTSRKWPTEKGLSLFFFHFVEVFKLVTEIFSLSFFCEKCSGIQILKIHFLVQKMLEEH